MMKSDLKEEEKSLKVLTIANRKGGAGKSTCAAHFSVEADRMNLKTILIDLDPQKTLEGWWNKREQENPYLLDVVADELSKTLEQLKEKGFDLCIIDTPGDASINAISGMQSADLVIIPSKPTPADLAAIGRTINLVEECKKPFIFVITQGVTRQKSTLQTVSALSQYGAVPPDIITNRTSYASAMGMGVSAADSDPNAREEVQNVWQFIYSRLFEKNTKQKQKLSAIG
jgi:chromosome partitioning protein